MTKLSIKTSQFCGLANAKDWQNWLEKTDKQLHKLLMKILHSGKGCKANKRIMVEIYNELHKRDKGTALTDFLTQRFPYVFDSPTSNQYSKQQAVNRVAIKPKTTGAIGSELNKHGVFKSYNPQILTFPQKKIITGDKESLKQQVQDFISDKIEPDYVIIDNTAYIEYFDQSYANAAIKVPLDRRDIYNYKQKLK